MGSRQEKKFDLQPPSSHCLPFMCQTIYEQRLNQTNPHPLPIAFTGFLIDGFLLIRVLDNTIYLNWRRKIYISIFYIYSFGIFH